MGDIVLDIILPGLDGLEVCRILRREMSVPILMLTARAEAERIAQPVRQLTEVVQRMAEGDLNARTYC